MKDVLTVPLIRPLTKLSLGVYLHQYNVLGYRQLTKKDVVPITHYDTVSSVLEASQVLISPSPQLTNDISDLVIAFAISYAFYILVERPLYYWIKIILQLRKDPVKKRFGSHDPENGKLNTKEEINLKQLDHDHHQAMRL